MQKESDLLVGPWLSNVAWMFDKSETHSVTENFSELTMDTVIFDNCNYKVKFKHHVYRNKG